MSPFPPRASQKLLLIIDLILLWQLKRFDIWDTAGQERYHSLAPMYYRGAKSGLIVYDLTSKASFERAKEWVNELKLSGSPNMIVALVGNKLDIVEGQPELVHTSCHAHPLLSLLWFGITLCLP